MNVFEKTIEVQGADLDELQHVNNVRYVQWIQDISREHWEREAPPELARSVVWVVLNHNVTYKNAAMLGDLVAIRTFVEKNEGVTSTRVVEMRKEASGVLLVSSRTTWCLLDAKNLKPKRIPAEIQEIFNGK